MEFVEHNNRKKAKKLSEFTTSKTLCQYMADKVKQYVGEQPTVFDGAVGSGQLERFLNPKHLYGIDVQEESCQATCENYPNSTVTCQSFFTYTNDITVDAVVMNPPFSLRFKELPEQEQQLIKQQFDWKKSGNVDDIFLLKSLTYTKRYGFYIMFPGITYRGTEQRMRDKIGNQLVELNVIKNGFEDTQIDVVFLVIDKEKTTSNVHREIYDCKVEKVLYEEPYELEAGEKWELPHIPTPKEEIDIDAINKSLDDMTLKHLERHLMSQLVVIQHFGADIDYLGFIKRCYDLLTQYELLYNFHSE